MSTARKYSQEIVFNNKCNNAPACRPSVCEPVACKPPVASNKVTCKCTCKKCTKKNHKKKVCCNNINTCNNNCNCRVPGFGWATLILLAFFI